MPLSWNEIKHRALAFSQDWRHETREHACCNVFFVSAFQRLAIHDLKPSGDPAAPDQQHRPASVKFPLADLHFVICWKPRSRRGLRQHQINLAAGK